MQNQDEIIINLSPVVTAAPAQYELIESHSAADPSDYDFVMEEGDPIPTTTLDG